MGAVKRMRSLTRIYNCTHEYYLPVSLGVNRDSWSNGPGNFRVRTLTRILITVFTAAVSPNHYVVIRPWKRERMKGEERKLAARRPTRKTLLSVSERRKRGTKILINRTRARPLHFVHVLHTPSKRFTSVRSIRLKDQQREADSNARSPLSDDNLSLNQRNGPDQEKEREETERDRPCYLLHLIRVFRRNTRAIHR